MKMTKTIRFLSLIICIVLIAAMALFTNGCGKEKTPETPTEAQSQTKTDSEVKELGEGAKSFDFSVVELDGKETKFLIHTDSKTVGEALTEVGLVEGEQGEYGLYVKKVNGITADYDKDGTYWGFFVNGEMAAQGVDMTDITEGESYSFKVSK